MVNTIYREIILWVYQLFFNFVLKFTEVETNSARILALFFGTAAAFNQKVFHLQLSNQNATSFCFCPEVNSAMLFREAQPIKLQKKALFRV